MSGQNTSASSTGTESDGSGGNDKDINIGDFVFDRDDGHSDPALVVNKPPKTADEWNAYGDMTVADDNPDYPAHAPVIVVSYRNEIADKQPELVSIDDPIPLRELHEMNISHYSFPAPRLRRADPEIDDLSDITSDDTDDESVSTSEDEKTETPETDTEPADTSATDQSAGATETEDAAEENDQKLQQQQQELEQFTDFLRDNGVRSEVDDGVVVAEKLGQSYEITLDGEVTGGGAYQDRLEQLVSDYSS